MNKNNYSRPFLDKLEQIICTGASPQCIYQETLKYLDDYDEEMSKLKQQRDEQQAHIERLLDVVKKLTKIDHKKGGSLGDDGAFYYKVSEYLFKSAELCLAETPAQSLEAMKAKIEYPMLQLIDAIQEDYAGEAATANAYLERIAEFTDVCLRSTATLEGINREDLALEMIELCNTPDSFIATSLKAKWQAEALDNAAAATDQIGLDGLGGVSKRRKQEQTSSEAFEAEMLKLNYPVIKTLNNDYYGTTLRHWLTWQAATQYADR